MRGKGFEPSNSYETRPSTQRLWPGLATPAHLNKNRIGQFYIIIYKLFVEKYLQQIVIVKDALIIAEVAQAGYSARLIRIFLRGLIPLGPGKPRGRGFESPPRHFFILYQIYICIFISYIYFFIFYKELRRNLFFQSIH